MILDAFRLNGKVALVTGASTGLGAAIAKALAEAGAEVICHGNTHSAEGTRAGIQSAGGKAHAVAGDLSESQSPAQIIQAATRLCGRIDILVNNAGAIRRDAAADYALGDWMTVMQVNLTSVFQLCQLAGRHMLARGSGKIVNIASVLSFQGGIRVPAYAAAKGGIAQLTKALANEWAGRNVNVNAIAPGYMETSNTEALRSDAKRSQEILERIPAARWGTPDDLAGAAVYLCSEASRYVHGHVLVVDGGWLSR